MIDPVLEQVQHWRQPSRLCRRRKEMMAVAFEEAEIGMVVFAPLKMEHRIQFVRVLEHEVGTGPDETDRWLVVPDNTRGASGDAEPYWVQHPWKVIDEEEANARQSGY